MKSKKIAIVTPSAGSGGAEKASTLLSIILNRLNYEVHFIVAYSLKDFEFGGVYYSLNISKNKGFNKHEQVSAFFKLRSYLRANKFDFIIDFRSRRLLLTELMFTFFVIPKYNKLIYTFHLPLISKYIAKPWFLFRKSYNKSKKVVCVSKGIEQRANKIGLYNTQVILNPIDFNFIDNKIAGKEKLHDFKFIIGVGRMDDNVKQFDHLMYAYSNSRLPKNNIHLLILGKGPYQPSLENYSKGLENSDKIHFVGFQKNPYQYMKEAVFFVLSSEFEGYPLVVLESLACGTPVIAYDCPTGPSEIIKQKENGILVPAQNKDMLIDAMNDFLDDKLLYKSCKGNARKSVEHLSMENIGKQWESLIDSN